MKTNSGNVFIIKFSDFGEDLGTRDLARSIRHEIEKKISQNVFVTFDFEGVNVISNSFADECFTKLFNVFEETKIKKNSHFKDVNPFVKIVITSAIARNSTIKTSPIKP